MSEEDEKTLAVVAARLEHVITEVDRIRDKLEGNQAHWTTVVAVLVAAGALVWTILGPAITAA